VQYAPYDLAPELGGSQGWEAQREAFGDTVIDTIAEFAPNIREIIVGRQVLTPLDIERDLGLSEGNIFQGELTLEQLFFLRPVPGWADYRTPIAGLYLCGSSGKVNLALDALPSFTALPGTGEHLRGAISISPSTEHMERAYDDAVAGRFSRRPYMDIVIPTLVDPSMAPPGKHTMSCFVQYAPYDLAPELGGSQGWEAQREAFGDTVIDTIAEFAPNIRDVIVGRQVLTPLDIERDLGLSEGNIFQAELSLEQLFVNRPAPGWARFRTPIDGLWLGGSAAHPGGGIMGAPGRLAAMEVLRSRGWRPRRRGTAA
jgi:phytoene dehydrogenase-like protein